jgi:hypothetical protein
MSSSEIQGVSTRNTDQDKVMVKDDFGLRDSVTNLRWFHVPEQGDKAGF